jgi:hypothetical protein
VSQSNLAHFICEPAAHLCGDLGVLKKREAQDIAERKKKLAVMLANVAELGAERMEQTIGKASLRDAVIATGVSVDKVALLTGPKMGLQVNIANIQPPSAAEIEERKKADAILDAFAQRLMSPDAPPGGTR